MSESTINRQSIRSQRAAKEKEKEAMKENILAGIIDPESRTYTFEREMSVLGERKTGKFTAKYLSILDRLKIGTIRARLLDGVPSNSLDATTDDISFIMAYLKVALIEAPSWFDYEKLDNLDDLTLLWREVMSFMSTFRVRNGSGANAGDSTDTTGTETVEDK